MPVVIWVDSQSQWCVDVYWVFKLKTGWQDSNNRTSFAVERNRFSESGGIATKISAPQTVADYRGASAISSVLFGREVSAQRRVDSQGPEKGLGTRFSGPAQRLGSTKQIEPAARRGV